MSGTRPTDEDYERLLEFRTGLRVFLKWSQDRAAQAGLAPSQHQLLLAIRGHRGDPPSIGDVADHLLLKPHSAGELVSRAEKAGLVKRKRDPQDGRMVRLYLTPKAGRLLESITESTLAELDRMGPRLRGIWSDLSESN